MENRPRAEIEIEAAKPKSRGHPTFNKRETRFEIVLILQDSDGAGFSGFGCAERVVLVVMMAIISDVWEMRFAGRAWAVPETRFGLGMWLSRLFEQLMRT